jgi:hypothetical protein
LHRVSHGVPEGSEDIAPMHAFPMEYNMDMMGGGEHISTHGVGLNLTMSSQSTFAKAVTSGRSSP